jgi:fluoroquinolone transport system permease protein
MLGAASVTPAALRGRVLRELVLAGALPRTTRWPPVLAGWLMAAGLLAWKADDVRDAGGAVTLLRVVAVLLATSVVALADDAAENQLAAAPVPLAWRYGVRCGVATLAVAIPWAGALLWVRPGDLAAALSLECAALTAVALAVAGGVARWSGARDASIAAGPAVFAAAILASVLPSSWALYATPGHGWAAAHLRWAGVLTGALALLLPTVGDPAQRRWSRDRRRRHADVLAETLDRSDAPRDPR